MKLFKKLAISAVGLLSVTLLFACSEQTQQQQMLHQAVAIESADECHLCGMLIMNFSGPKGELFQKGVTEASGNKVKKFCSTRDMFSYYLEPENKRNITSMLVHDMRKMPWDTPKDEFFIDARKAWFVAGSEKTGAMGKTLASFSQQNDAKAFADEFGGKVLRFEQVDISVLL